MDLRKYQIEAIERVRAAYRTGVRKVLLHMPTGAGKTVVFCEILKAIYKNNKRAMVVVRGRQLVAQASARLSAYGVPHAIWMANKFDHTHSIFICSISTLYAREEVPDGIETVVADEVHQATSPQYKWLASALPSAWWLGVTATPYDVDLAHVAETVVKPIAMKDLIAQGHLVQPVYYAPSAPNLTNVRVVRGDYQLDDLARAMDVVGDIVPTWMRLANARRTICFAVNIQHSKNIVSDFRRNGIEAEHMDNTLPEDIRSQILARLVSGETKVVCNVGLLNVGVDIPSLECLILARPTRSYNLHVQQVGRGLRPFTGKDQLLVLDHAGNVPRHGCVTAEPIVSLTEGKERTTKMAVTVKRCYACYAMVPSAAGTCPQCGESFERPLAGVPSREGVIDKWQPSDDPRDDYTRMIVEVQRTREYKPGWVFFRVKERYGEEYAKSALKRLGFWNHMKHSSQK